MGRIYRFKLHIVVNDKGELLDFIITQANLDDTAILKKENFLTIFGRLFCRKKAHIKRLKFNAFDEGLHLVNSIKANMKNTLILLRDKFFLEKYRLLKKLMTY